MLEVTAQKCWYKNKWFPMSGKLFFNWVLIFFGEGGFGIVDDLFFTWDDFLKVC